VGTCQDGIRPERRCFVRFQARIEVAKVARRHLILSMRGRVFHGAAISMVKHRTFNADRFLDKFQGHEDLLRAYVRLWPRKLTNLSAATLDVPTFKQWLVDGESKDGAKDEVMEGLYRCYDLSNDRGHEDLRAAAEDSNYEPDPEQVLPVECLALKVRAEREDVFSLAYDRHAFEQAEKFSIYKGARPCRITKFNRRKTAFEQRLRKEFQDHKKSERVLVRTYREGDYTHFVVYHEKRVKSVLIFKGTKIKPKVAPTVFRPAQQDFLSYNETTGQVEIEAGYENEETKVRQAFAKCFFDDADFFDGDGAARRLNLGEIADAAFNLDNSLELRAKLVELRFALDQVEGPTFDVKSKDVLRSLSINGLRTKLDEKLIALAAIKIFFPDDKRGKRVELSGENKVKFNRATHADEVFALLAEWGLRIVDEVEDEEASPSDITERDTGAPAHDGKPRVATAGNRVASRGRATKGVRRGRPR
jgi:hypothetical protein